MKFKILSLLLACMCITSVCAEETSVLNIEDFRNYTKEYVSEEITVCAAGRAKTYMDYRATTAKSSRQYQFIHNNLTVDETTGFLYDKDGFIAAALGSFYSEIGDRFYFTLDSGVVLPIVKSEEKANVDTDDSGCYHLSDNSVIEFVIDKNYAMDYFGRLSNNYVLNGNYNNHELFNGNIVKVERVTDEKLSEISLEGSSCSTIRSISYSTGKLVESSTYEKETIN